MIELLVLGFKGIHSALGFPGQDPYDMHSAALALEKLSRGCHEDPLLDVRWSGPYFLGGNLVPSYVG